MSAEPRMNRSEIERGQWVERYLAGRLSETEMRRFEAYWIEHPDLIGDIEATARLKEGLAQLRERGELAGLLRRRWWPGSLRLLVLAACTLVAVAGLATWRAAQSPPGVLLAASASALPRLDGAALPRGGRVNVMRLRSAAAVDAVLELPDTPRALELRVLPEEGPEAPFPATWYEVSLAELDGQGALRGAPATGRAVADAEGFVSVFLDSRTLRAARYRLRIEPLDASAAAAGPGFLLEVRAARETPP